MTPNRFVILGFGRTGSNWLCELLDSHPSILCHRELFGERIGYAPRYAREVPHHVTMSERDADPGEFLERVLDDDLGHAAVGLKLLNFQQPQLIDELVRRQDVRKLVLRRDNLVRAFLSRERAALTGGHRDYNYSGMRVRLDHEQLIRYSERWNDFYRRMQDAVPGRVVVYERLDDPGYRSGLLEFLGVEPLDAPLKAYIKRQSQDSLRAVVTNFEELSAALAGTPLHAQLYD